MSTSKAHVAPTATRTARKRPPASSTRLRASTRGAYITDPQALLTALAQAEREEQERAEAQRPRALTPIMPSILDEPAPVVAIPVLHDGERIAHSSPAGIIVIRRRRAA